MTDTDPRPKPYLSPQRKSRTSEKFDRHVPMCGRQYSGDRPVQRRSLEYTMQHARKDVNIKTRDREAFKDCINHSSRHEPEELSSEEIAVNRFREWKPEDESLVFNIRPGRRMFPFLKDVIETQDYYSKHGGDDCENLHEPVTRRYMTFEDSGTPSHIVLTRNTSSFVCEPLDQDDIVEVL